MIRTWLVLCLSVFLIGCAKNSSQINAAYVSPLMYKSYDCQQLKAEQSRLVSRAVSMGASVDQDASADAVVVGLAWLVFPPVIYFMDGGNEAKEQDLAMLKGRLEAVQESLIQKRCYLDN